MKKIIIGFVFVLTILIWGSAWAASEPDNGVVVYVFKISEVCPSTKAAARYVNELVDESYSRQSRNGTLVLNEILIQEESSKALVEKYSVYGTSIILSERKNGVEVSSNNLSGVWAHFNDDQAFKDYVKEHIAKLL